MDEFANVYREADFTFVTSMIFDQKSVSECIERGVDWICVDTDNSYLLRGGISIFNQTKEIINKSNRT